LVSGNPLAGLINLHLKVAGNCLWFKRLGQLSCGHTTPWQVRLSSLTSSTQRS